MKREKEVINETESVYSNSWLLQLPHEILLIFIYCTFVLAIILLLEVSLDFQLLYYCCSFYFIIGGLFKFLVNLLCSSYYIILFYYFILILFLEVPFNFSFVYYCHSLYFIVGGFSKIVFIVLIFLTIFYYQNNLTPGVIYYGRHSCLLLCMVMLFYGG